MIAQLRATDMFYTTFIDFKIGHHQWLYWTLVIAHLKQVLVYMKKAFVLQWVECFIFYFITIIKYHNAFWEIFLGTSSNKDSVYSQNVFTYFYWRCVKTLKYRINPVIMILLQIAEGWN